MHTVVTACDQGAMRAKHSAPVLLQTMAPTAANAPAPPGQECALHLHNLEPSICGMCRTCCCQASYLRAFLLKLTSEVSM
jgi:hypothetical protein